MSRQSAGILLYRRRAGFLEVLLVHPGGPYWSGKDEGSWSIPKGEFEEEDARDAALREFEEELGVRPAGPFIPLTPIRQRGGKRVFAWACEGEFDVDTLSSNTFEIEWPPRSGRRAVFPEVDRAAWFGLEEARDRILAAQRPLLDELEETVRGTSSPETF